MNSAYWESPKPFCSLLARCKSTPTGGRVQTFDMPPKNQKWGVKVPRHRMWADFRLLGWGMLFLFPLMKLPGPSLSVSKHSQSSIVERRQSIGISYTHAKTTTEPPCPSLPFELYTQNEPQHPPQTIPQIQKSYTAAGCHSTLLRLCASKLCERLDVF